LQLQLKLLKIVSFRIYEWKQRPLGRIEADPDILATPYLSPCLSSLLPAFVFLIDAEQPVLGYLVSASKQLLLLLGLQRNRKTGYNSALWQQKTKKRKKKIYTKKFLTFHIHKTKFIFWFFSLLVLNLVLVLVLALSLFLSCCCL